MIITEKQLITFLEDSINILLIEPPYRKTYIPLALAKISSFCKENGKNVFYNEFDKIKDCDLICVTTLFTNDLSIYLKTINDIQKSIFYKRQPILIGGIALSLIPDYFKNKGLYLFTGYSSFLDSFYPDYSIDYKVKPFWSDCDTIFTQRGCINKCKYCMVHKLEPEIKINPKWRYFLENSKQKYFVISDNNLLSSEEAHYNQVLDTLIKLKKPVIFNNGIYSAKVNEKNAEQLAKIKYIKNGLRLAFDRIQEEKFYRKSVELLKKSGLNLATNTWTYVLFNFNDTPQEAYYRMKVCWHYKSAPYVMQYRPLDSLDKGYVGKYWTKNLVKAFRYYHQTYGFNRGDKTFLTWLKDSHIKLTDYDLEKWHFEKEKYNFKGL